MQVLVLLGPPGAGKGTQAVRLAKAAGLVHVSTGDLFRENLSKGTPVGQRAKGFMDQGKLVPDDVVLDMLFERVARPDCKNGYLLDGFPRTIAQAEALAARLGSSTRVCALSLVVPDSALVERLTGRLTCRKCSSIYHLKTLPPKVAAKCDKCGSELYQRTDDSPEVVQKRLVEYSAKTAPLIAWYRGKGVLREVDGNRSEDEVFRALEREAFAKGAC